MTLALKAIAYHRDDQPAYGIDGAPFPQCTVAREFIVRFRIVEDATHLGTCHRCGNKAPRCLVEVLRVFDAENLRDIGPESKTWRHFAMVLEQGFHHNEACCDGVAPCREHTLNWAKTEGFPDWTFEPAESDTWL